MKIYHNKDLLNYQNEIKDLSTKFTQELEELNMEFSPKVNKYKRITSNWIYYIVMTIFLFIFISITVILEVIIAHKLILLLYGINIVITSIGVFFYRKNNEIYNQIKVNWSIRYNEILKYQNKINYLNNFAAREALKTMCLTLYGDDLKKLEDQTIEYEKLYEEKVLEIKDKIKLEIKTELTNEEVLAYYNEWGSKISSESVEFDFLEARRKKAMLYSKKNNEERD